MKNFPSTGRHKFLELHQHPCQHHIARPSHEVSPASRKQKLLRSHHYVKACNHYYFCRGYRTQTPSSSAYRLYSNARFHTDTYSVRCLLLQLYSELHTAGKVCPVQFHTLSRF